MLAAATLLIGTSISAAVGYGLWTYRSWGRLGAAALTILGMLQSLFTPGLGTVLVFVFSAPVLWALLAHPVTWITTPAYRAGVRATPHVKIRWYLSPFFWAPLVPVLAALAFALVFALKFL